MSRCNRSTRSSFFARDLIDEARQVWEVQIDNFTDDMLAFYGWYRLDTGHTFSKFFNPKYDEAQPVMNAAPRFILVDDVNDARFMASQGAIITKAPRI